MIKCRSYEQLTAFYNNVSGTTKRKLSQSGHNFFSTYFPIFKLFLETSPNLNLRGWEIQYEMAVAHSPYSA